MPLLKYTNPHTIHSTRQFMDYRDTLALIRPDATAFTSLTRSVASVSVKTNITFLDDTPLKGGDLIELCGAANCGKSMCLLHAAVWCVLPERWGGMQLGGQQASVVFFNNDRKFDMDRFIEILYGQVCRVLGIDGKLQEFARTSPDFEDRLSLEEFTTSCLDRLYVVSCDDSFQFLLTIQSLQDFCAEVDVKMVIVDSLQNFNWQDKGVSEDRWNQLQHAITISTKRLLSSCKPAMLVAKPPLFTKGAAGSVDYMSKAWQSIVKLRFLMVADFASQTVRVRRDGVPSGDVSERTLRIGCDGVMDMNARS